MISTAPQLVSLSLSLSLPLLPFQLFSHSSWCDPVRTLSTHTSAHKSPKVSHSNGFPMFFQNKKMFWVPAQYGFHISYVPYSLYSSCAGLIVVLSLTSICHFCTCHLYLLFCPSKYLKDFALTFSRPVFQLLSQWDLPWLFLLKITNRTLLRPPPFFPPFSSPGTLSILLTYLFLTTRM